MGRKLIGLALLTVALVTATAQKPRPVSTSDSDRKNTPAPAPQTVKAKYQGGVFGYRNPMKGSLAFDDANQRLVFRDEKGNEKFHFPYESLTAAFSDTQKLQPTAAAVASKVPYVGLPASFIKTKVQFLTIQYADPDSKAAGITSFKLENKELLPSVLVALADKSGLTARGDIYVRKKE